MSHQSVNYLQRTGHSSCIRCDFETTDKMSFEEQDRAMDAHLAEKHPNWMTDGGASILPARMPKPDIDWRTCGVVELAVRNPNVKSYMEEWEGRALKAEKDPAELRRGFSESIEARER